MEIKIWGSRGGLPHAGSGALKYGGDTSCLEILLSSGLSFIIDAGSGLAVYDRATPKEQKSRVLCFTHGHYGHIQGLPFFSGLFNKEAPLVIIGAPQSKDATFRNDLEKFFDGVHTPFTWENLPEHEIWEIRPNDKFELFGAVLETCPTLHPGGALAWKITADGWTFALACDHEIPLDKKDTAKNLRNERLMGFLAGADVVLADAHFTDGQRPKRSGFGHSSPGQWQKELSGRGVGKIYFSHFNPAYNDKIIDAMIAGVKGDVPCEAVFDGAVIRRDGLAKALSPVACLSCEFNRKVASFSDTHSIVEALLEAARELGNAEGGTVYLVAGGELNFATARNDLMFPESASHKYTFFNSRIPITTESIAGYVAKTGEILNIEDVYELPEDGEIRFNPELDIKTGYRTKSVLAVPLVNGKGKIVGVLQLINSKGLNGYAPFGPKMAEDIAALAQMATVPLERSFLEVAMILRVLKTAALRDPEETAGHVQRVGAMAAELYHHWALKHNVDPEEILFTKGQLRLAAMLHDVGKVGVPDAVLKKPGKLTDYERGIMEKHVWQGAALFEGSDHVIDRMAKDIAMHHHARWDGAGYTGRKDVPSPAGENIPVWARITAIADAYDTMVSPRGYQKVWTPREARACLRQEAGKRFDPDLVESFREISEAVKAIYERFPDDKK